MPAVVYKTPKGSCEPFQLSAENNQNGLRYWKELIYEHDGFVRVDRQTKERKEFDVDEEKIDHWVTTGKLMLANGVEIPLPNVHAETPEAKRGGILDFEKRLNKSGKKSLWGLVEFSNAEYAKQYAKSDVSIYADRDFTDGKGVFYQHPIRHVALTDYPVIPGLEKFEQIVASFGDNTMAVDARAIAKKLGVPDDTGDDALEGEIDKAIDALLKKADGAKPIAASHTSPPSTPATPKRDPLVLSMFCDNRTLKIDALTRDGKILPAEALKLKTNFTNPEALHLSNEGKAADGFDTTYDILFARDPLAKAPAVKKPGGSNEKSGPQVLPLDNRANSGSEPSSLAENARKRAEKAAVKR